MLRSDTSSETVRPTEGDITGLNSTGHIMCFGGRVDDLVNGLHREVKGHKLALESINVGSPMLVVY